MMILILALCIYWVVSGILTMNYAPILFFPAIFLPAFIVILMEMSHNSWKENLGLLTIGLIGCLCSTI
mgnify:CR=1 FL=1